jgi:wobble nucleotide-excising tRNase
VINQLQLLRNVGQFDSVSVGAQLPLAKLTLIYAGNGRGKTTIAAILRSLGTGNPVPIVERHRLAAMHAPHVILTARGNNTPAIFQNGTWSRSLPEIAVFDDIFVAENVCSGVDVEPEQRQRLHDLILGARGVVLSRIVQEKVAHVEEHNRALRAKGEAIPAASRGGLALDAFCVLQPQEDAEQAIQEAERNLAAGRAEDAIRNEKTFDVLSIPDFDIPAIAAVLARDLPQLDATAAARVQTHVKSLGNGGEAWVADGFRRIGPASENHTGEICPFCAQPLDGAQLISIYRSYFSSEYAELKQQIAAMLTFVRNGHSGEVTTAFERAIRVAAQRQQFWKTFLDVQELSLDTAAIARAWKSAAEQILGSLHAKQAAPLERLELSAEAVAAVNAYHQMRNAVLSLSADLQKVNAQIAVVKERAATANLTNLMAQLASLKTAQARFAPQMIAVCDEYLEEKAAKTKTEALRDTARGELDEYRKNVFPTYEAAINVYLQAFNAGFSLRHVNPVNTRGGSACTYFVLINNVEVPLSSGDTIGPAFKNTLSSGDRNTLALAFFFASLDQDPRRGEKIVVIDDPMTSLDEHRALTTIQQMRRLETNVTQMIVLSHSKPFLCDLWQGAEKDRRTAIKITRDGAGSTLSVWDVNQDCITEHDRRHILIREYMQTGNSAKEREVAQALRPIMESFIRVAYPEHFPPGSLLGPFHGKCQQKSGTPEEILSPADTVELRDLLDYGNKFHHDSNTAWETATVNDSELNHFCQRTLKFTRHR